MRRHLNTLFVTLEGAYLRKDGAAIDTICSLLTPLLSHTPKNPLPSSQNEPIDETHDQDYPHAR